LREESTIPKLKVRRLRSIVWSMVSKTALTSRVREREREKKGGKAIDSCMVDRVEKVNETGVNRMMFAISWLPIADNLN